MYNRPGMSKQCQKVKHAETSSAKGEKKKSKHMYFIRVVKFVVLKPCSNFAKIFQNSPQNNMCIKIMIFMTSSSKTSFTFPQAFLTLL